MIRVLHFYARMNTGGAETFIMNVYRNIDNNKYQFDFLCSSDKAGFYDDEIKKLGGNIYYYKISRNPIITINRIRKAIKSHGPYDAVHSPMMFFSSLICIAAKMSGIKKIIVHSHSAGDIKKNSLKRKFYISMSRKIINRLATSKLACGNDAADYLFGKNSNAVICHNGIDYSRFSKDYSQQINKYKTSHGIKNEVIIGEVASFLPVKNHEYYIGFAKRLLENNVNFKIILVGEGELKTTFLNRIRDEGLSNVFIVEKATNEIPFFMNLFDIYMMPSLYEGFPLSVIEAASCGDICLLSNNISKEARQLGSNIYYFDINSFPDADKIRKKRPKNNSKIQVELKKNGFLIEETVKLLLEEYNK